MKFKILIAGLLLCATAFAETNGPDGGRLPGQGTIIGGKGADGLEHFFSVDNTGALNITSTTTANVITTATPSNVSATTTSGTAMAANASRKDAVFVNYGTTNGCFLARGATAVVGQGIYLAPNGGSYSIDANNLYKGLVTVITASGTTTVSMSEGQ